MRGEKEVILLVGWVGVFRLFCNLSGGKKINKYPKARSRGERGGGGDAAPRSRDGAAPQAADFTGRGELKKKQNPN